MLPEVWDSFPYKHTAVAFQIGEKSQPLYSFKCRYFQSLPTSQTSWASDLESALGSSHKLSHRYLKMSSKFYTTTVPPLPNWDSITNFKSPFSKRVIQA